MASYLFLKDFVFNKNSDNSMAMISCGLFNYEESNYYEIYFDD